MHVTVVVSTTLSTITYDSMRSLLQLEFCSGAVYRYFGVPSTVHQALLAAPSKGGYFNQAIRGRYAYVRVPGMRAAPTSPEVPFQREQAGGPTCHVR